MRSSHSGQEIGETLEDSPLLISHSAYVYRSVRSLQSKFDFFRLLNESYFWRYIDALRYAWKFRRRPNDTCSVEIYSRMLEELRDASLLRLIEAFLESAPQLILQLCILGSSLIDRETICESSTNNLFFEKCQCHSIAPFKLGIKFHQYSFPFVLWHGRSLHSTDAFDLSG